ncbi:helix-turn-helix domain-containing protein [Lonsdalea quercina]|uniref:helix-turn-helix domain-containing protein n=1 Tax=Lonsdalea quercina TaxID=71657 RepID=UPI003976509B
MIITTTKKLPKKLTPQQAAVISRIESFAAELVGNLTNSKKLARVSTMTDTELAKLIFETQLERTSEMSPREQRRMARLNEGAVKFTERLKALGGTCRASQAAQILGVSRQTINNRLQTNKILAVKTGGEYRFPLFQFDGNQTVNGLDEVLTLLGDFSSTTKTSFLTSMYFFDEEQTLNVIDALKKYGTSGKHFDIIRRQAALFGHQIPS